MLVIKDYMMSRRAVVEKGGLSISIFVPNKNVLRKSFLGLGHKDQQMGRNGALAQTSIWSLGDTTMALLLERIGLVGIPICFGFLYSV